MEISHRRIWTGEISMHVAEAGQGPLVILCHGFPELWYSWRYQIRALAAAGYHVVAPDLRGHGETDRPDDLASYSILHNVGDMVGLLDALGENRAAAIVGHDMGCHTAWAAALIRSDRFPAVAALSVPWQPRASVPPLSRVAELGLERLYIVHFQRPGVAEAELEADPERTLRRLFYSFSGSVPAGYAPDLMVPESGLWLDGMLDPPQPLSWMDATDLAVFVSAYARTGFAGGLAGYRNFDRNWELTAPWQGATIEVPALFLTGALDPTTSRPAVRDMIAGMAKAIPLVSPPIYLEGAGHWVQQERPDEVTAALHSFLEAIGAGRG
ncbi:MAG TPA: alpha/beta hydrolase [Aliidongia sp.]|nr:alpha/beta hydrolase [Aliidongia sp.]